MKNIKYLNPEEQRNLLESRGIIFNQGSYSRDIDKISKIGYYKLKEFAYPFAYKNGSDLFYKNLKFKKLLIRYYQDKNLRMFILYAIEDIEVYLNSLLSKTLGKKSYGAFGYLEFKNWCDRSFSKFNVEKKQYEFKKGLLKKIKRSGLKDIRYERNQNEDGFPTIWTMVDCLTFGDTVHLIDNMSKNNKLLVANSLNCTPNELISWISCMNFVRNACVHNSDLLDLKLSTKPIIPKRYSEYLYTYENGNHENVTNRVSVVICILKTLMDVVNPKYKFGNIKDSFAKIINNDLSTANYLGFKDEKSYKDILNNYVN